jgi:ankyrin repeat protein
MGLVSRTGKGEIDEKQKADPNRNTCRMWHEFTILKRHHADAVVVCLQKMFTPLHCAASSGTIEVVKVLLQRGANKLAKNKVQLSFLLFCFAY